MKNLQIRSNVSNSTLKVRQNDNGDKVIGGLAIPFNSLSSDLGGYYEMFATNAKIDFVDDDVYALHSHDWTKVLGRRSSGTLHVEIGRDGLSDEIILPNTNTGNELYVSVDREDIRNQSFGFYPVEESWQEDERGNIIVLVQHALVAEVSPAARAVYKGTSLDTRSFMDVDVEATRQEALKEFKRGQNIVERDYRYRALTLNKMRLR